MLKMERFKEAQTKTVLSEYGSRSDESLAQGNWANINRGSEGDGRMYLASGEVCSLLVENNDRLAACFHLPHLQLLLFNNVLEVVF